LDNFLLISSEYPSGSVILFLTPERPAGVAAHVAGS
jgi:hypothetical protein